MNILNEAGISVTARRSFGVDIDAACGQLYAKYEQKQPKTTQSSKNNINNSNINNKNPNSNSNSTESANARNPSQSSLDTPPTSTVTARL